MRTSRPLIVGSVVYVGALGLWMAMASPGSAAGAGQAFAYTGNAQDYLVPGTGPCSLSIAAAGANGGGDQNPAGGAVIATVEVPGGDHLTVIVGGHGTISNGGYGGGGSGGGSVGGT